MPCVNTVAAKPRQPSSLTSCCPTSVGWVIANSARCSCRSGRRRAHRSRSALAAPVWPVRAGPGRAGVEVLAQARSRPSLRAQISRARSAEVPRCPPAAAASSPLAFASGGRGWPRPALCRAEWASPLQACHGHFKTPNCRDHLDHSHCCGSLSVIFDTAVYAEGRAGARPQSL